MTKGQAKGQARGGGVCAADSAIAHNAPKTAHDAPGRSGGTAAGSGGENALDGISDANLRRWADAYILTARICDDLGEVLAEVGRLCGQKKYPVNFQIAGSEKTVRHTLDFMQSRKDKCAEALSAGGVRL